MTGDSFVTPTLARRVGAVLGPLAPPARRLRDVVIRLGSLMAGLLALLLRALPLGARLRVVDDLRHNRRLIDFAPTQLYLDVTSSGELTRLQPCAKEPETVEWLLSYSGSGPVLYDIGANVGTYSLIAAAADPAARVVALEPGYATFPRLVDNVRANSFGDRVAALPIALGDRTELVTFAYATVEPGAADHPGILGGTAGRPVASHPVLCYRLDDLIERFGLPEPTLLKLDVDGAETGVLRGATATLRSKGLASVLVEVREGSTEAAAVAKILSEAGFAEAGGRLHDGGAVRNVIWKRARASAP